jgi:hypothetical protein
LHEFLYSFRNQETMKGSAAFVALQASLAWHVKEQAAHAAVLRDASDALAAAADAARQDREVCFLSLPLIVAVLICPHLQKTRAWRREFERHGAEAVAGLRRELAALRRDRDDLRARLDAASLATNKVSYSSYFWFFSKFFLLLGSAGGGGEAAAEDAGRDHRAAAE